MVSMDAGIRVSSRIGWPAKFLNVWSTRNNWYHRCKWQIFFRIVQTIGTLLQEIWARVRDCLIIKSFLTWFDAFVYGSLERISIPHPPFRMTRRINTTSKIEGPWTTYLLNIRQRKFSSHVKMQFGRHLHEGIQYPSTVFLSRAQLNVCNTSK